MQKTHKKPELLSPVQDFTSLSAAIQNGADAVFFGVKGFNMRQGAKNFTLRDLGKIAKITKKHKVKSYLTLNTIVYENELKEIDKIIRTAKRSGIDAIICWDMAIIQIAKKYNLEFHISTQASISNSEAARFYKKLGAKRIVLARECNLSQIKNIKEKSGVEIEIFVHGAMCVSISGRCFLSQFMYSQSANRGECRQPCRKKYLIKQIDGNHELVLGNDFVLSPKDLCTITFVDKFLKMGIDCLKIEGRNRSPEYVAVVTRAYRTAIDYYFENKSKRDFKKKFQILVKKLENDLQTVFNRGQSSGFFMSKPINEWSKSDGNQSSIKKIRIGVVSHFFPKIKVAEIKIQGRKNFSLGDTLYFQGPITGSVSQEIKEIQVNHVNIKSSKNYEIVATKVSNTIKKGDEVFCVVKNK